MTNEVIGGALALGTACCWCISALAFEGAGRRAGSVPINLLRLFVAFALLTIAASVSRGHPLPVDASDHQWKWLLLSGFIGFFIGDVTAFRAFVILGARLTTLIACTSPIFALCAEMVLLPGTGLHGWQILGSVITIAGVAWVVSERTEAGPKHTVTLWGVLLALAGSIGQGVGAAMTGKALAPAAYDIFATGQVRMIAGIVAFTIFVVATRRTRDTIATLRNGPAMGLLSLGAFAGPFLGVSLFIASLKYITPSMTQTITSLGPVLMIPFVILVRKERVSPWAIAGTCVAVGGVWLVIRGAGGHG